MGNDLSTNLTQPVLHGTGLDWTKEPNWLQPSLVWNDASFNNFYPPVLFADPLASLIVRNDV